MNTVLSNRTVLPGKADVLEARFGLRLTARLNTGADALPHDVSERLRVARQNALALAANPATAAKRAAATSAYVIAAQSSSGLVAFGLSGDPEKPWWSFLGMAVPVLLLLLGLIGIDHWHQLEQVGAAADIDAALLGDDLPPSAFTDPGFAEFLLEPVVETAAQ